MAVPYMAKTLRGWTKKTAVKIITQSVVDHKTETVEIDDILDCNFQPLKPTIVNRKPEEQRTWKWWNVIVRNGRILKTDDIIIKDSIRYKIELVHDWSESGFQKYEAIEDYQ